MPRRLSLTPTNTGPETSPWCVNLPANVSASGKRERRFFETKAEAQTFAQQERTRLENFGRKSTTLTPGQLEEAAMAFERIARFGVSLNTVISEFEQRHDARAKSVTFKAMFERFQETKKNKSEEYRRDLKYTLPRFPKLHDLMACDITAKTIEPELAGMTPSARNAFMRYLRAAFNYGIDQEWLSVNPIDKLGFEDVGRGEAQVLTPAQASALIAASLEDLELLPYHVIACFAGVRPKELSRLDWEQVNLKEKHIEIRYGASKTGGRRIIEMEPNLEAWLKHYIRLGGSTAGKVTPTERLRDRLRDIRTAAKITPWVQDVMRHSYASYHLQKHGDLTKLVMALGHRDDPKMLWEHYHRAVKKSDAAAFWKIVPEKKTKIVPVA